MKFKRPTRDQEQSVFEEYRSTQPDQRTGTFRKAYLKLAYCEQTSEQVAVQMPPRQNTPDISKLHTQILPSMRSSNQGQQVIHDSSEFDIRVISLPSILDRLIKNHEARYGKYPDEIHLRPDSIEILKAWGLTTGDNIQKKLIYKGFFALIPDKTLSCVSIVLDSYKYAI